MRAVRTERSNFTYLGPVPRVADLPCRREDGKVFAVYELTDEERLMVANGAQICLGVYCEPIPPVSMSIVNEPLAPAADDMHCERCDALYVADRNLTTCGHCGGALKQEEND
jgi:hypothetical protein